MEIIVRLILLLKPCLFFSRSWSVLKSFLMFHWF